MPARFTVYTDPASALRIAQTFAGTTRRELLLAAIREAHPAHHAGRAIDPRPVLSTPIAAAPAVAAIEFSTPEIPPIEIANPS